MKVFEDSRRNYGCRKIKVELKKQYNLIVSCRKIRIIMQRHNLISNYTIKQFKVHKTSCNESEVANVLNREFNRTNMLDVVVSDLTYVNVSGKWNYVCLIEDLFNSEIGGYAVGKNKDALLVYKAICKINKPLSDINIFHTDRGNEFKNKLIDDVINTFGIQRSLSNKGNPIDNACAESLYKVFKTEFAFHRRFESLGQLEYLLFDSTI